METINQSNWTHLSGRKIDISKMEAQINNRNPKKEEIVGLLASGLDFHFWMKDYEGHEDSTKRNWKIKNIKWTDHKVISDLLKSKKVVLIGFNNKSSGSFHIWFLEQS